MTEAIRVAYRAGFASGMTLARRRLLPWTAVFALLAGVGWGLVVWPDPPPTVEITPQSPPREVEPPTFMLPQTVWANRLAAEGLDALGPITPPPEPSGLPEI